MSKKSIENKYKELIKDYLIFRRTSRGIKVVEPPKTMVENMAKDVMNNEKLLDHIKKVIEISYGQATNKDEIKNDYEKLQEQFKNLD